VEEKNNSQPREIHPLQKLMDNPWLLLALGFLVPTLSYTIWGLIELFFLGSAKLP
jgi:hypothetical protein